MPLDDRALEQDILRITSPQNGPKTLLEAAALWSLAYHKYASGALAGGMVPTGLVRLTIQTALLGGAADFFVALDSGLTAYWTPVAWATAGFTGVTATAVGLLAIIRPVGATLASDPGVTPEVAAKRLASALHTYTKAVTVTMTNVTTAATSVVPVE